jgi:hypothetical protein
MLFRLTKPPAMESAFGMHRRTDMRDYHNKDIYRVHEAQALVNEILFCALLAVLITIVGVI